MEGSLLEVEQLGHEADHTPSSAVVMKGAAIPALLHVFMA
jgi:hypothetical protein